MIKVAITGGICSGKSTMCKYLSKLGYSVYYSDDIAKLLIKTNKELRQTLITEFGSDTFVDGVYNTKYITNIVFNDNSRLKVLDNIFMSYMDKNFDYICEEEKDNHIFFYESALIHKHNKEDNFDYVIAAYVSEDIALDRLVKRNNLSIEEAKIRLVSQNPNDIIEKSNFHINTHLENWEDKLQEIIKSL